MPLSTLLSLFLAYGLLGLLLLSFLSSLVFIPGYASFLVPIYVRLHFNPWLILIFVSAGATLGELVNYYLGYIGSKYVFHKEIKKAEKWVNKWGEMSVLIVNLIPLFPADFVSVLVGFLRMNLKKFLIGVAVGKTLQYAIIIFGSEIFFKYVFLG